MLISLSGFSQSKPSPPTTGNSNIDKLDPIEIFFDSLVKLVVFKETPLDTFALVRIEQIRNANEKFIYMYQLVEEKDTLEVLVDHYKELDKIKSTVISSQAEKILKQYMEYNNCQRLNDDANKIISQQKKEIKKANVVAWGAAVFSAALLVLTIIIGTR